MLRYRLDHETIGCRWLAFAGFDVAPNDQFGAEVRINGDPWLMVATPLEADWSETNQERFRSSLLELAREYPLSTRTGRISVWLFGSEIDSFDRP